MRLFAGCQFALLAAALMSFPLLAAEPVDEAKALTGVWKPKEASLGDNKIAPMLLETATLTIDGETYTITVKEMVEKGTMKIDPKPLLKTMDIYPTQGNNNGKTFPCIYKLEGDTLTICYSLEPSMRPEDFEANSNTLLVVRYERVKSP